jgi:hypothetical protein
VVEQPVRHAGLLSDIRDAGGVIAVPREDAHRGVEDETPLVLLRC